MDNPKLLSVILLSYYSGERIRVAYNKIKSLLNAENIPFEFIRKRRSHRLLTAMLYYLSMS